MEVTTPMPNQPTPPSSTRATLDRHMIQLKRRLIQEAQLAVSMLEGALEALWKGDAEAAREIRKRDDAIDQQEVEIEQECFRLLALEHPYARDFRFLTFILKVNSDVERVADHASSIAKMASKLGNGTHPPIKWPTALVEMGQRVPVMCHQLMRAVLDENPELARKIADSDETIDQLDRKLVDETEELIKKEPSAARGGLYVYRVGRELERIGDLMKSIAEDVIYLTTGEIVRHEARRAEIKAQAAGKNPG
jgi:phosphate transport system protein